MYAYTIQYIGTTAALIQEAASTITSHSRAQITIYTCLYFIATAANKRTSWQQRYSWLWLNISELCLLLPVQVKKRSLGHFFFYLYVVSLSYAFTTYPRAFWTHQKKHGVLASITTYCPFKVLAGAFYSHFPWSSFSVHRYIQRYYAALKLCSVMCMYLGVEIRCIEKLCAFIVLHRFSGSHSVIRMLILSVHNSFILGWSNLVCIWMDHSCFSYVHVVVTLYVEYKYVSEVCKKKRKSQFHSGDKYDVTHNSFSRSNFCHSNNNMLSVCIWWANRDACVGEIVISWEMVQIKIHSLYVLLVWSRGLRVPRYLDGICTHVEIIQGMWPKRKHFVG